MGPFIFLNPIAIGVFLFASIILAMVFFSGLSSKCPACGKWWGLKELERREIGREPGMKLVTRTEVQHNNQGPPSHVPKQIQVQVMRIKYDGSFQCNSCGHTLVKEIIEEKDTW